MHPRLMLATIIGLVDFPYLDSILDSMIYSEFPPCLRLLPFFSTNVRISWLQMGPHSVWSRGCSDGSRTFRELTTLLGTVITVVPGSGIVLHMDAQSIVLRNVLAADSQSKHEDPECF